MIGGGHAYARTHPYSVSAYASWSDHIGTHVGFASLSEAQRFASLRPEPIIDLVARGHGTYQSRRMVAHPASPEMRLHDHFPDLRP